GFFVLMVDAFGAGERGLQPPLGEYHGEMVGATLYPTGRPLSGIQVYENQRAVDYMLTRPEVDPDRLGITGCSGGGNQTMYAGAFDERFKAVVPVCSVGTYQAYLGAACCMCEVVPAAMSYTEEWGILSLVAPRALMLINATKDGFQFSIGEAKKSLTKARHVFKLYDVEAKAKHATFDWKHDYHQPMREEMYGWMTLHLKGEGDGSPIAEPKFKTEEADTLRCFPGDKRPDTFVTLPQFAAAEGRAILKRRPIPKHAEGWEADQTLMRESLPRVLGGFPAKTPLLYETVRDRQPADPTFHFSPEPGITVFARRTQHGARQHGLAVLLDLDQGIKAADGPLGKALLLGGWHVLTVDLRATGATANAGDAIRRAPDHNSAEWSMWAGRPLLGQWVHDVRRLLDTLERKRPEPSLAVIGVGPASLVALAAAAVDKRIDRVATVGGLASYVSDVPYENQRLGIIVPGILKRIGDVAHLAALAAPRRLVIAGGVTGGGEKLAEKDLAQNYAWTKAAFGFEDASKQLKILTETTPNDIVASLT
ncbi:MAG: prolyl oligopeptidase family serine peptidase, partial [Planctomycetes bacterium]|nr:prolyl oligopeptidase family serine peptidase [Planctomycetota bacterium]